MEKYKLIAICGKAGSGKDTLVKELTNRAPHLFHRVVCTTTRPARENEINGKDYNFVSIDEFIDKRVNDFIIESSNFNNWMYGTEISALSKDKINLAIYSPKAIKNLKLNNKIEMYVYYIDVTDKERLIRQLNREDNPNVSEIVRRYSSDYIDFENISSDFDYNVLGNQTKSEFEESIEILLSDAKNLIIKND